MISPAKVEIYLRQALSAPLVHNLAAVTGGTALAQVIVFAFSLIITRIYTPEVFGIQGVFLSLISVLWPLVALRYPMAIVVAPNDREVQGLVRLSLIIAAVVCTLIGAIILGFQAPLSALMGADALGPLLWLLPPALFLVALQDVTDFRAARLEAFRVVGVVTVAQAALVNLARVIGGLVQPAATTLVIATSLSYGLQALMLRLGVRRRLAEAPRSDVAPLGIILRKYREFPIYRMPADLVNAVSQTAPVFMLATLFSPTAAGLYVLARSVVNLPLNVIGNAAGNVFYARAAEMARQGQPLFPFVLKATLLQLLVLGGATLLAALAFPPLFALVFGEAWRAAGEYAQWMALWVVGMLANIPSVRALPVIGRQALHLLFNALIMVGGVLALLAGHAIGGSANSAVASYSIAIAGLYALQIVTYLHQVGQHDRKAPSLG